MGTRTLTMTGSWMAVAGEGSTALFAKDDSIEWGIGNGTDAPVSSRGIPLERLQERNVSLQSGKQLWVRGLPSEKIIVAAETDLSKATHRPQGRARRIAPDTEAVMGTFPNPDTQFKKGDDPRRVTQWKKGPSGNPGGKTKAQKRREMDNAKTATKLRRRLLAALDVETKHGATLDHIDPAILKLLKDSEDRGLGTATQAIEHSGEVRVAQVVRKVVRPE